MVTLVLKGEVIVNCMNYIGYENKGIANLDVKEEISHIKDDEIQNEEVINYVKKMYLDEIYNVFKCKVEQTSSFIKSSKPIENWNLDLIYKSGTNIYNEIKKNYLNDDCFDEINLNDDLFKELLLKVKENFYEIDEDAEDDLDKFSQYYDFLNDMFISVKEVLDYEIEKVKKDVYKDVQNNIGLNKFSYNRLDQYQNKQIKDIDIYLISA